MRSAAKQTHIAMTDLHFLSAFRKAVCKPDRGLGTPDLRLPLHQRDSERLGRWLARPALFNPAWPKWRQAQQSLWNVRQTQRMIKELQRVEPSIPSAAFAAFRRRGRALVERGKAELQRCPPPRVTASTRVHRRPPTAPLGRCDRDIIRQRPRSTEGPPRNGIGPLSPRGPVPTAKAVGRVLSLVRRQLILSADGASGKRLVAGRAFSRSEGPSKATRKIISRNRQGGRPWRVPRLIMGGQTMILTGEQCAAAGRASRAFASEPSR